MIDNFSYWNYIFYLYCLRKKPYVNSCPWTQSKYYGNSKHAFTVYNILYNHQKMLKYTDNAKNTYGNQVNNTWRSLRGAFCTSAIPHNKCCMLCECSHVLLYGYMAQPARLSALSKHTHNIITMEMKMIHNTITGTSTYK